MAQRPSFDLSRMSAADRLIAGGAGLYFIWSFLPVWYRFSLGDIFGVPGGTRYFNAWGGVTVIAAILSLLALVWVGIRIAGVALNINVKPGLIDLALGALGLLFTILGLVVKREGVAGFAWGLFVGILLALVWAYGAYMKYNEPQAAG